MKSPRYLIIFLFASVFQCASHSDDPIRLAHNWYFQIDSIDVGIAKKYFAENFEISNSQQVYVPEYWDDYTPKDYDGTGWYFTEFEFKDQFNKAALRCESVDDDATIWLNGEQVGQQSGANREFKLDVTPYLRSGTNRLTVRIEDHGGPGGLNGAVDIISFETTEDLLKGKYFDASTPTAPEWAKGAVLYELNTRQFSRDGTFHAVEARLPQLRTLGVDIIWIMPIHPIGEKKRKGRLGSYYSVKDYYGINPEFGTLADFKRLVRKIHDAGMYVIIDMVANHTAWDNPLIEQHPDWYTHNEAGEIIAPVADWTDVADLNYDNHELRTYMIEMLKYWVREVDIDGYRCDVASMVPTDFWIAARAALDSVKPVFMLAEAETPELNALGFDMTYASAMHHLFNAIAQGTRTPAEIDDYLTNEYYTYPHGSMRMRFISNHDENSWQKSAITRMGREGAKVGALLTFTLPGTPLIYNGQEVGNTKSLAFFERDPIQWRENEFRPFYRKLTAAYHQHPALVSGSMTKLNSSNDEQIYAFVREYEHDQVVVIVNFKAQPVSATIALPGLSGRFTELFTGKKLNATDATTQFSLSPWEYRVYVTE